MAKKNDLSPQLKARYSAELVETLERIDDLTTELKEEVKERKGEISALAKAAFRLRRLLSGHEAEQTEIPGSEIPVVKGRRYQMNSADESESGSEG